MTTNFAFIFLCVIFIVVPTVWLFIDYHFGKDKPNSIWERKNKQE